jgi:hypothetical protein
MAAATICCRRAPPLSAPTANVVSRRLGRTFDPWMSKLT